MLPGESELSIRILRHLVGNPQATDTLEVIARWCVADERMRPTVEQTERALKALVAQGFLVETATTASGRLFRLNDARRKEAARVIAPEDDDAG